MQNNPNKQQPKKKNNLRSIAFSTGEITDISQPFELPLSVFLQIGNNPAKGVPLQLVASVGGREIFRSPRNLLSRDNGTADFLVPLEADTKSCLFTLTCSGAMTGVSTYLWNFQKKVEKKANDFKVLQISQIGDVYYFEIETFNNNEPAAGNVKFVASEEIELAFLGGTYSSAASVVSVPVNETGQTTVQIRIADKNVKKLQLLVTLEGTAKTQGPFELAQLAQAEAEFIKAKLKEHNRNMFVFSVLTLESDQPKAAGVPAEFYLKSTKNRKIYACKQGDNFSKPDSSYKFTTDTDGKAEIVIKLGRTTNRTTVFFAFDQLGSNVKSEEFYIQI